MEVILSLWNTLTKNSLKLSDFYSPAVNCVCLVGLVAFMELRGLSSTSMKADCSRSSVWEAWESCVASSACIAFLSYSINF